MDGTAELPFFRLDPAPVLGQCMGNVTVLRLDQVGGRAQGNKLFKLRYNLQCLREQGISRIVSFGGAWSNHLHALAAVGAEQGLETIGIVRGGETSTAMLDDAQRWGMQIVPVSRSDYRRRHEPALQRALEQRFAPCVVLPEGGSNAAAVRGCMAIASAINANRQHFDRVLVPVGSGATLAGLVAGLAPGPVLQGISALRGATDLEERVLALLEDTGQSARCPWDILHQFHCGGFARANDELREFIGAFESVQALQLDPVYTAKMFFAASQLLRSGAWSEREQLLLIHTGGLQGRRGYSWLDQSAVPGQSGATIK